MNIQELLVKISERLSATASVKNVYGDPVTAGDRTVIPVASVRYVFGGGGGAKGDLREGEGGGGGGKVSAKPCGALEITPRGTRFVPFIQPKAVGFAFAVGIVAGAVAASLTSTKRIEIVKGHGSSGVPLSLRGH
jgi:uncharacterized spore protein YtfJ